MLYRVHLAWARFELTMLVVIGTNCIGSYKSSYYTITTTTAPNIKYGRSILLSVVSREQSFFISPMWGCFFLNVSSLVLANEKGSLSRLIYCESKTESTCLISKKLSRKKKRPMFLVKRIIFRRDIKYQKINRLCKLQKRVHSNRSRKW